MDFLWRRIKVKLIRRWEAEPFQWSEKSLQFQSLGNGSTLDIIIQGHICLRWWCLPLVHPILVCFFSMVAQTLEYFSLFLCSKSKDVLVLKNSLLTNWTNDSPSKSGNYRFMGLALPLCWLTHQEFVVSLYVPGTVQCVKVTEMNSTIPERRAIVSRWIKVLH